MILVRAVFSLAGHQLFFVRIKIIKEKMTILLEEGQWNVMISKCLFLVESCVVSSLNFLYGPNGQT